jgi:hypothetical protein
MRGGSSCPGDAQKPLCCQSGWCYTPAEKDGGVLVPRAILFFAVSFSFLAVASAQTKTVPLKTNSQATSQAVGESSGRLPVKRVVLYKNGIGYFEHSTRVHGNQDLTIDFTTAQLNDVLKSLTAVDLGEGRISGVQLYRPATRAPEDLASALWRTSHACRLSLGYARLSRRSAQRLVD